MPLGSIAEWRVRIGSSWCALGRPFKTRSLVRGGPGRLQKPLTLNQLVTMMTVLIIYTALNVGIPVVWRTDHYRPYLGLVASWMFDNLVIIGLHYLYPSLCRTVKILPWLIALSECQCNQLKKSKQRTPLQFIYVAVVVVAVLETTRSMAASIIFYRLLQSGDVEQNPGPALDYDSIDSEKALDEDDLFDVMEELYSFDKTRYYNIGTSLRLRPAELDSIESSFNDNPERALTKVVTAWLQKHYNVDKFGPPSWQMLVKGVHSPAGGNDYPLAKKIAANHPANGGSAGIPKERAAESLVQDDKLSIDNTREVLDVMWDYRAKWRFIGITLGIDAGTLDAIECDNRRVEDCLTKMITTWLRGVDPTRSAMKATLQTKQVTSQTAGENYTGPNKLEEYTAYLKSLYKALTQNCHLGSDHWPPPVTDKVFSLAMIKAEDVQRRCIEDKFVRESITGKVDDILKRKVPIKLKNIFVNIDTNRKQRKVLIEGAPGCGKSTLSLHICHEWMRGNLLEEYSQVILVRLRELTIQNAKEVADLLPRRNDVMGHDLEKEISSCDGERVLFIFDGWDELPADALGREIIMKILESKILHKSSIIITSRPVSSTLLQSFVNCRIEILGFTKDELQLYFRGCLDDDMKNVTALQQRISVNPVVAGSCYLPLNASILVHLFKCGGNVLPSTQYGIFYQLVISCVHRHLLKMKEEAVGLQLKSLEELPPSAQLQFKELCKIAYDGVVNDKIIFELKPGFNTLGLLQGVESFAINGTSHSYNYLHLTIQELLAAMYMANELKEDQQVEQFRKLFGRARFSAVFQFYAAITKLQIPGVSCIVLEVLEVCVQDNKKTELSSSHDDDPSSVYVSSYNFGHRPQPLLLSLLHCLFEAQRKELCQMVAERLEGVLYLRDISLSPADCLSVGYFLTHCTQFEVSLQQCSIDADGCKALFRKDQAYDLQSIDLNLNNVRDEGAIALSDSIKKMTNLQKLNLEGNNIGDKGASALSVSIKMMTNLQYLGFSVNNIKDEGAIALSDSIKKMTNLQKLYLNGNNIGAEGAIALSDSIKTMTELQTLYLEGNNIGDEGACALSVSIKKMTNLQYLGLRYNNIGDKGAIALSDSIKMTNLQLLGLRCNNIGDKGAIALSDSMKKMTNLQELYIGANGITAKGEEALRQAAKERGTKMY